MYLACGTVSSAPGDAILSTSTLGSALMAASRMEGRGGRGEVGGVGVVAMTVSVWLTGWRLTCRVASWVSLPELDWLSRRNGVSSPVGNSSCKHIQSTP